MSISELAQISKSTITYEGVPIEENVIIQDYVIIYSKATIKIEVEI